MIETKSLQKTFNLYFHGKYSFDDFINTDIKEHITNQHQINNKTVLSIDKKLTEFHNFINIFIINQLDFDTSACFSYAKNTTVYDCLKPHKDNKYFLSTDITNFFGSICSADISKTIQHNINEKKIFISDINRYRNDIIKLLTVEDFLPIGFSTSGRLSNSILFEFDKKILIKCRSNNITYSRYADDLIFSSNNEDIAQIKPIIKDILNNMFNKRLKINHDKTKTYSKKSRIKILGLIITPNGDITIDKKMKSDIETAMHFYANDTNKFNSFLEKKFDGKIQKVFGIVGYINSVNKDFLNKLRKKYGNYIVDSFLRKSAK
jgi:RNA-directed DNA polymerase